MNERVLIFEVIVPAFAETVRIYSDGGVTGLPEGSRINNLMTPRLSQRLAQDTQNQRLEGILERLEKRVPAEADPEVK